MPPHLVIMIARKTFEPIWILTPRKKGERDSGRREREKENENWIQIAFRALAVNRGLTVSQEITPLISGAL